MDSVPLLSETYLRLTKEVAQYYGCSWGEAIEAGLPYQLRERKKAEWLLDTPGNFLKSEETAFQFKPENILVLDYGLTQR